MHGGPSQVDTFDYKPRLAQDDGKDLPFAPAKGTTVTTKIMKSPWKFAQHGESGIWVSELFPEVAAHVDDLCMLNGMHTEGQSHGQAVLQLHTGAQNLTRPSLGAWVMYGLAERLLLAVLDSERGKFCIPQPFDPSQLSGGRWSAHPVIAAASGLGSACGRMNRALPRTCSAGIRANTP